MRVAQPGFRTKSVVVVTTFLDPRQVTREDLVGLYRARWHNELDLRSIKCAMGMSELRCKAPEQARKEVWAHVLAHNLIRTVMAQPAAIHDVIPRSISFTGALQTLAAFRPLLELRAAVVAERTRLYRDLPAAIATHRVGGSPRPLRAAAEEAEVESLRLADPPPRRDQTPDGKRPCREVSAIRPTHRFLPFTSIRRASLRPRLPFSRT